MAFDAGMLCAVLSEIRDGAVGGKIEKIAQPLQDEVHFLIKNGGKVRRLVVNAGASAPRITFSSIAKENPPTPPGFCMLLRKHLAGARLQAVEQAGFERVAFLVFSAYDEMGYPTEKRLAVEMMGKYSNLMLLSAEGKILAAMKTVDFSESVYRQILPGMRYELPPPQEKRDPRCEEWESFLSAYSLYSPDGRVERFITDTYLGTATQVARSIVYRAVGNVDVRLFEAPPEALFRALKQQMDILNEKAFVPTLYFDEEGMPKEYFYMDVSYFGEKADVRRCTSFEELFDLFFCERDRLGRIRARACDLVQLVSKTKSRVLRRLEVQREELADAERGEEAKHAGDRITANIYRLRKGMDKFDAMDYESDPPKTVKVLLDTRLTPAQNAQKMYRVYAKAKTARRILAERIADGEKELLYLESVAAFLDAAETEEDLLEIREELETAGYISKKRGMSLKRKTRLVPIERKTHGGYTLLCGRNNIQNDYLTFHVATKGDLWFHAKNVPGSHVLLLCGGEEPSAEDYTEAAAFAAFHSKASHAGTVAVDYTRVKNLKKPPTAKPGFVIYHTNFTAYVTPKDIPVSLEEKTRD